MKRLGLLLCLVCLSFLMMGQEYRSGSPRKTVIGPYKIKTDHALEIGSVVVSGIEENTDGSTIRCKGDCELTIGRTLLKAGQVTFHSETGEAEAQGNVRIQLLPLRVRTQIP